MTTDQAPLIELRGVGKTYVTEEVETHALANVDLRIHQNEFVSIAGPSGSGKSTLLALLGLLDRPSSGELYLDGVRVDVLPAAARALCRNQHIGFIFQSFNLIDELTVEENVALPLRYRGVAGPESARRTSAVLEQMGLAQRSKHYPAQLSGGQQQRVAIARAIVGRPQLILADEPTGNLDSATGELVMQELRRLQKEGTTLCMVTHDPRYVDWAERTVQIFDGRLREDVRRCAAHG
jgi:putative ABC transport system ATP-binding protein